MKGKTLVTALLVCIALYAPLSVFCQDFQIRGTVLDRYNGSSVHAAIPAGVTSIGYSAFWETSLTSVTIPASVTSIEDTAFGNCSSLTSITVDAQNPVYSSVEGVLFNKNRTVLIKCPGGKKGSFVIPAGVISIRDGAFSFTSLTSVTIPTGVAIIGNNAFFQCGSLANVTIPSTVTSIGRAAFYQCASLANVTIPAGVTSIGDGAFDECSSLIGITVDAQNRAYSSLDGVLFNKNRTVLITCPGGKKGSYTIPAGVTSIGNAAFRKCNNLASITIPVGVTSIGEGAFAYCSSLTSIAIPSSVTSIGWIAFAGCSSLTSVTIPASVTSIGNSAFRECSILTSVTIAAGVTSIEGEAFIYCRSLTSISIPASVTSVGDGAFAECPLDPSARDDIIKRFGEGPLWQVDLY